MHELDVTLNNGFKHIWRDNIKAASIFLSIYMYVAVVSDWGKTVDVL